MMSRMRLFVGTSARHLLPVGTSARQPRKATCSSASRRLTLALLLAAVVSVLLVPTAGAQEAADGPEQDNETLVINGHGWGHGRGMSQYGSAGYAVDIGWSADEILDHYYGGTVAGTNPNENLTVRLESASDQPTVAGVDSGAIVLMDDAGNFTHIGTGGAIRLTATPAGFVLADAPSCAGPFTDRAGTIDAEQIRITSASTQPSGGIFELPVAGVVVVGDWDGDGDDDLGVVDGNQWSLWSSGPDDPEDQPDFLVTFGDGDEIPLVGDWDGDGDDTPTLFEDGGSWTVLDDLVPEATTSTFSFGQQTGDVPIVGDWDGDGDSDEGVRRGDEWRLRTGDGAGGVTHRFTYGRASDVPAVGDWNGDGIDDPGFVRGSRIRRKITFSSSGGVIDYLRVGPNGSARLIGDWDGDGIDHAGFVSGTTADLTGPLLEIDARTNPNIPIAQTIHRCESAGVQRYYRGELRAVANGGNQRTVNAVPVESYLRSVVPLEMPASWANLGGGDGAAAVQVQAVSARSYALAENRASYARTCDTISCQVYAGRAVRNNGTLTSNEHPLADAAIAATSGVVRMRDGEVARTEFSSSTGGWTAGGVFPAVEDEGDSISINPNHDWTTTLEVGTVELWFSGRTLDKIETTGRNGFGQDGGRVTELTLTFGDEVFTMTGNEFRRAFGLKSDWFTVEWERFTQPTECICPRDWPDHGIDDRFAQ